MPDNGREPEFTSAEKKSVRELLDAYEKSQWLGRLLFKATIAIGGLIAFLVTLKGQLLNLLRG